MTWWFRAFIPNLVLTGLAAGTVCMAQAPSVETKALVEGNNAFALDLYGRLRNAPGNLFFSPYSISTCLAMTYAGARGLTETQMAKTLHFPGDQSQLHAAFGELQRQLSSSGGRGVELNIANALWAQAGHPFLEPFLQNARREYQANLNQVDFRTQAPAATSDINRWVAEKTKDRIQNILSPGSLNAQSRLVLVNAIYFKGLWAVPFEKPQTSTQPFHLSKGSQVPVPFMHHLDTVRYLENNDFRAVELPYISNRLSMVVLLPREVEGCAKLEERLTPALLATSLAQMSSQKVDLFLPRFKLEFGLDLAQTLSAMGMPNPFGSAADFSGIDGAKLLYISGVFHKAWGEVNEEGTEAAAATAVAVTAMAIRKPPPPPPVFRADHPFIFLIRDPRSGSVLFLGRLMKPAA